MSNVTTKTSYLRLYAVTLVICDGVSVSVAVRAGSESDAKEKAMMIYRREFSDGIADVRETRAFALKGGV